MKARTTQRDPPGYQRANPAFRQREADSDADQRFRHPVSRNAASGSYHALSAAVILREVIDDCLGVVIADRSAEGADHLRYFGIPGNRVQEGRIHRDIIEAVAAGAVRLDLF